MLSSPLIVVVNGGATIQLVARRQPFEMDCASYSSDPDDPLSTLSFAMECTKLGGEPCSVPELVGSTFDETGGVWSLSAETLFIAEDTGIEYTFTCVASSADGIKSASASTMVRVARGERGCMDRAELGVVRGFSVFGDNRWQRYCEQRGCRRRRRRRASAPTARTAGCLARWCRSRRPPSPA